MRIAIILIFSPLLLAYPAMAEVMYVEVQSASIRKEPKHWAASVAAVAFGDKLEVVAQNGAWFQVSLQSEKQEGVQGFIHQNALTKRKIILSGQGQSEPSIEADDSSIVLAGKGFNRELEEQYSTKDTALNYKAVDAMQARVVAEGELEKFLAEGTLGPWSEK